MQTRASPTTLQREFEPSIFWFAAEKLKCWRKNVEILNLELVSIEVKCQNFNSSATCQIPHRTPTFTANFPSNELCDHETDLHYQEFLMMWLFPENVQISFDIDFCWQRTTTTTKNRHQIDNGRHTTRKKCSKIYQIFQYSSNSMFHVALERHWRVLFRHIHSGNVNPHLSGVCRKDPTGTERINRMSQCLECSSGT